MHSVQLMLLVVVEGLSYRSTALDVPIGTVISRLARARLTIGESLDAPPARCAARSGSASSE